MDEKSNGKHYRLYCFIHTKLHEQQSDSDRKQVIVGLGQGLGEGISHKRKQETFGTMGLF